MTTSTRKRPIILPTEDDDYDQIQVPQGSLFIELYCCRNPNNPAAPSDLYVNKGGYWYLDLGRQAPDDNGKRRPGHPVWRLAIVETKNGGNGNAGTISPQRPRLTPTRS